MRRLMILLGLLLCFEAQAASMSLSNTLFEKVGREEGVDPQLLYAVALAESAYSQNVNGNPAPYPWTLRAAGPFYANNHSDAVNELQRILMWSDNVDVGLMQINVRWHGHRVNHPIDLLDPETNLRIGARILAENLRSSPNDLVTAIGRYHSFDPERSKRYGLTILRIRAILFDE